MASKQKVTPTATIETIIAEMSKLKHEPASSEGSRARWALSSLVTIGTGSDAVEAFGTKAQAGRVVKFAKDALGKLPAKVSAEAEPEDVAELRRSLGEQSKALWEARDAFLAMGVSSDLLDRMAEVRSEMRGMTDLRERGKRSGGATRGFGVRVFEHSKATMTDKQRESGSPVFSIAFSRDPSNAGDSTRRFVAHALGLIDDIDGKLGDADPEKYAPVKHAWATVYGQVRDGAGSAQGSIERGDNDFLVLVVDHKAEAPES